jgi:O-acetyl-ADP-ribose deacetylase (regulator of RNase III)
VETGLVALVNYLKTNPIKSLAIPALGCGNGGLDWKLVKPMIVNHLAELDLSVWIYEPQIKGGN